MGIEISNEDFAKLLEEKAKAGDAEFQYRVGECYYNSSGVEKNYDEAMKWYLLAANQEHARAQFKIGRMYANAQCGERNFEEAVKWYELSAKQGYVVAQNNLAVSYEKGDGVDKDMVKAFELYEQAAKQSYWRAAMNLGRIYFEGDAVEQDLLISKSHYKKALDDVNYHEDFAEKRTIDFLIKRIATIEDQLAEIDVKLETARKTARSEVFISYSHKDAEYVEELRPHLKALKNAAEINWWDDANINPGDAWDREIKESLSKAKVIVLMASQHFFASDYIWGTEYPKILEAANNEGATILWVMVRKFNYEEHHINNIQSVMPNLHNPLYTLKDHERDEIYTKISKTIRDLYKNEPTS